MGTLFRNNYSQGWRPNDDEFNGNPQGLLRMDNLVLDEQGIVSLTRGTQRLSSGGFADAPNAIYSRIMDAGSVGGSAGTLAKVRYVSAAGAVYRNWAGSGESDFSGAILTGGDSTYASFGSGWGHTFIFSGDQKRADPGSSANWRDLGIPAPSAPTTGVNTPPSTAMFTAIPPSTMWNQDIEGVHEVDINDGWVGVSSCNETTLRGINQGPNYGVDATWDTTDLGGTGKDTPNDFYSMYVKSTDTGKLIKIRVEFLLNTPSEQLEGGSGSDVTDYYWFEWYSAQSIETTPEYLDPNVFNFSDRAEFIDRARAQLEPGIKIESAIRPGENNWFTLQCTRSQCKRSGMDDSKNWSTVKCVRFIFTAADVIGVWYAEPKFYGGETGSLNGWYSYKQVNVRQLGEGYYTEIGIASPETEPIQIINSSAIIYPASLAGCDEAWIFRSSTTTPGFYRVAVITNDNSFTDSYSDLDALRDNIYLEDYRTALPNDIRQIVGPYYDRMIYFDYTTCYPSFRYDAGSYDSRHEMQIASLDNEVIYWATKVVDGLILVGTSHDIYSIRGDFSYDDTTGLLNVTVEPLGIRQPPISWSFTVHDNAVIYLAEDGWRAIAGTQTNCISTSIDLLYRGYTRHGIDYVLLSSRFNTNQIVASKNRLVCSMEHYNLGRALHIFDTVSKSWRFWHNEINTDNNPLTIYTEQDGTVLFSTTASGDKYLYQWDIGNTIDEGVSQSFILRTTYDCDGKPNNRKDSLTLKIVANTNSENLTLRLRGEKDGSVATFETTLNTSDRAIRYFNINSALGLQKWYQLEILGTTQVFELYEWSVEYLERPTQLNYYRIEPQDLGTVGRKRLPALSFSIDTLGNNVVFTPVLDGAGYFPSTVLTNDKATYSHLFTTDTIAYMAGGTLSCESGTFEFYGLLPHKEIEILPDPLKYKYINTTNFGTTRRKRFIQIGFVIDTRGQNVTFTPYIDNVAKPSYTYNTSVKTTVAYLFATETTGIDFRATITGSTAFEFYNISLEDSIIEQLPAAAKVWHIPFTNFGTTKRKRIQQIGLVIDTGGQNVTFTPNIDSVPLTPQTINTSRKDTVILTYNYETTAVDFGGLLTSDYSFEFYGLSMEDSVYEALPPVAKYLYLNHNNFGTTKRKRFSQVGLVIDTFGHDVVYTPYLDGVAGTPSSFNTSRKDTVIHFFTDETTGIDLGGTLFGSDEFEFYGLSDKDAVYEVLPTATKFLKLSCTNFGVAARKRVRTWPLVIDTKRSNVTFTPYVDGVAQTFSIFNTSGKRTVLHYFTDDVFGIDYCGTLYGTNEFEFYESLQPENVETLPVAKKFDQIGPMEFNREGRIRALRLMLLPTDTSVTITIYSDDTSIFSSSYTTVANKEQVIEISLPKGINLTTTRVEISSAEIFHRFWMDFKVDITGSGTEYKWVRQR